MHSWRDIGKLGYGNGGAADTPWTRQGIFIQSSLGLKDAVNTGGPGLSPERCRMEENIGLKTIHEFVEVNWLCLTCNLLLEGHQRLMASLKSQKPSGA